MYIYTYIYIYICFRVQGLVAPPPANATGPRVSYPPPSRMLWVQGLALMIGPLPPRPCVEDRPPTSQALR